MRVTGSQTLEVLPIGVRDDSDVENLSIASPATVSLANHGVVLGVDDYQIAGTVGVSIGSPQVAGVLTDFVNCFGRRNVGIGGAAVSAVFSNVSTVVTAASAGTTLWLTGRPYETLKVGDLIGNPTTGWRKVVSVDSDVQVTVSAVFLASGTGGATAIENPTLYVADAIGTDATRGVIEIDSGNILRCDSNFTVNNAGTALARAGRDPYRVALTRWYHLWLCKGTTGTSLFISTQRSTPYLKAAFASGTPPVSGYGDRFRRLGAVRLELDGAGPGSRFTPFAESGARNRRERSWEWDAPAVLAAFGGGAWAQTDLSLFVPPTATIVRVGLDLNAPTAARRLSVRASGHGDAALSRPTCLIAPAAGRTSAEVVALTDGAQRADFTLDAADGANPGAARVAGYAEEV